MLSHALVIAAALMPSTDPSAVTLSDARPSRTRPLVREDALYSIPGVMAIAPIGDLDGDGKDDLVVLRCDPGRWWRERIPRELAVVSARDGRAIRTLWTVPQRERTASRSTTPEPFVWDVAGDIDGDGLPDLLVGLPGDGTNGESSGTVLVVSGATGEVVRATHGASAHDRHGYSIAFVGDLDGDGHGDYAVGAPECDPTALPPPEKAVVTTSAEGDIHEMRNWIHFADGTRVEREVVWREQLAARSDRPGHVRLCSGADGSELGRIDGTQPGHAFGMRIAAAADLDGDGRRDLLIASDWRSASPRVAVSAVSLEVLRELPNEGGVFGLAGDVDGDGTPDHYFDGMHTRKRSIHGAHTTVVLGDGEKAPFELPFPDWGTDCAVTVPMGDLDGDGADDLLLGDANFHVRGPGDPGADDVEARDMRAMTLADALALEPEPWCAFTWESGAAWVYSGRTRRVIMGAWGAPGSRQGMGLGGAPVPDVDGDGLPEVAILDGQAAHVFPGPGSLPEARPGPTEQER